MEASTMNNKCAPVAFEIDFKENVSMLSPGKTSAKVKARLEERRNQIKMEKKMNNNNIENMDNNTMNMGNDTEEALLKKEMIEEKLMKAKINRESCRKNKMRVL